MTQFRLKWPVGTSPVRLDIEIVAAHLLESALQCFLSGMCSLLLSVKASSLPSHTAVVDSHSSLIAPAHRNLLTCSAWVFLLGVRRDTVTWSNSSIKWTYSLITQTQYLKSKAAGESLEQSNSECNFSENISYFRHSVIKNINNLSKNALMFGSGEGGNRTVW